MAVIFIVAIQVVAIADTQDVTIQLVEPDPICYCISFIRPFTTLKVSIDNVSCHSISRISGGATFIIMDTNDVTRIYKFTLYI
jgi:hypothetical protein